MYSPTFDYVRAGSVQEAVHLLGERQDAKLLAGGHSLIPLMKLRQASPGTLVDIGRIAGLKGISKEDRAIRLGSLTTHAMVAASGDLPDALTDAAEIIADLQVRNRGTIGGNVSHADPASDLPTVFVALGATFHVAGSGGERAIPAADFFTGLFETALAPNEVLTAVEIPATGEGTGSAYAKMINPASGYAMVGAAAMVTVDAGKCTKASVVVGGLTPKATKAPSVESALVGQALTADNIAAAAQAVAKDLGDDLLGDLHASAEYRKAMAPVYVKRALKSAAARAGT
ncbi:MAG: xanthine dehydrogenase family protein subunit M [Anaerolineales bacterium]|jgi:carbon-monoxide dehydrogenase medium subunit